MNQEWFCSIILLLVIITVPSFITPIPYFTYEHEIDGKKTTSYDIVIIVISLLFGVVPVAVSLFLFIKCFGDKGNNGAATTIRYVLSKLRIPGFWGASIHNKKNVFREKAKNNCSLVLFIGYFVALIVVFYTLVGVVITNSKTNLNYNTFRLLNGTTLFKPDINESREETRVRVHMDLGYVGVTNSTSLMQGTTEIRRGTNQTLDSINPIESFGYTLTPGSVMTLTVTSNSNMTIFYKKDNTVIEDKTVVPEYELSVNETNSSSYLINISYPGPDPINITYRFELKPMIYNVTRVSWMRDYDSVIVKRDEFLAISRYTEDFSGKELIEVDVLGKDLITDTFYKYQWTWYCLIIYLCPILIIFEYIFTLILVGYHSAEYTESYSEEKDNKCKILGHINITLLLGVGLTFFVVGISSTAQEIDSTIHDNAVLETEFDVYSGVQSIFPLNDTENPALNYKSDSSDIKISAVTEIPSSVANITVDCNPGSLQVNKAFYGYYYIHKGYSFEWDFISSGLADIRFIYFDGGKVVYNEDNVNASKHKVTVNNTGLYYFDVDLRVSSALLTFNTLNLTAPYFDLSNCTVWSEQKDISMKKLDESVKYIVIEPAKLNITPSKNAKLTVFKFDDHLTATTKTNSVSYAFTFIFVALFLIAWTLMIIDCMGKRISCCYICAEESESDKKGEKASLLKNAKYNKDGTDAPNTAA